jgi:hypothetical protein
MANTPATAKKPEPAPEYEVDPAAQRIAELQAQLKAVQEQLAARPSGLPLTPAQIAADTALVQEEDVIGSQVRPTRGPLHPVTKTLLFNPDRPTGRNK